MYLVERSDTSHGIYLRMAFMTVFALHPETTIRGQLLQKPWLLTGKLWVYTSLMGLTNNYKKHDLFGRDFITVTKYNTTLLGNGALVSRYFTKMSWNGNSLVSWSVMSISGQQDSSPWLPQLLRLVPYISLTVQYITT